MCAEKTGSDAERVKEREDAWMRAVTATGSRLLCRCFFFPTSSPSPSPSAKQRRQQQQQSSSLPLMPSRFSCRLLLLLLLLSLCAPLHAYSLSPHVHSAAGLCFRRRYCCSLCLQLVRGRLLRTHDCRCGAGPAAGPACLHACMRRVEQRVQPACACMRMASHDAAAAKRSVSGPGAVAAAAAAAGATAAAAACLLQS